MWWWNDNGPWLMKRRMQICAIKWKWITGLFFADSWYQHWRSSANSLINSWFTISGKRNKVRFIYSRNPFTAAELIEMSNSMESIIIFSIHFLSHLLQTLSRFERPMQATITQVPGYFWVGCLSVAPTSQHPLIDKTFEWVDRITIPWEFTFIFEHGRAKENVVRWEPIF
jgi:hypothetical protein